MFIYKIEYIYKLSYVTVATLERQNIAEVLKRQIGEKIVRAVKIVATVAAKTAAPMKEDVASFQLPANVVDATQEKPPTSAG